MSVFKFKRFDPRSEKERQYDNINNEGGSGYNPFRAERQKREADEARKQYVEDMKRPEFERQEVTRKLANMNWYDPMNKEELDSLRAREVELDQIINEKKFKKLTESGWTPEVTAQRREIWNAAINAGEVYGINGKVDIDKLMALRKRMGFTEGQVRDAVEFYKQYKPSSTYTIEHLEGAKYDTTPGTITEIKGSEYGQAALIDRQTDRTTRAQSADVARTNKIVVLPGSPRVAIWVKDPGRMDVQGIDTPPKFKIPKTKVGEPVKIKVPKSVRPKRNLKGLLHHRG